MIANENPAVSTHLEKQQNRCQSCKTLFPKPPSDISIQLKRSNLPLTSLSMMRLIIFPCSKNTVSDHIQGIRIKTTLRITFPKSLTLASVWLSTRTAAARWKSPWPATRHMKCSLRPGKDASAHTSSHQSPCRLF